MHSRSWAHLGDISSHLLGTPHGALAVPSHIQMGLNRPRYMTQTDIPHSAIEKLILFRESDGHREPVDFDVAVKEAGFGKFHWWLLMTCGLIFLACSASTTTLSYVLPAATCSLNISSHEKGIINASPLAGMVLGTFVWGAMSDIKGRKYVLISCLLLDLFACIISSLSFHKWFLLTFRIVNGFGVVGAMSLVFAYMGEFLVPEKRDSLLASLEMFWTLGLTYVPAVGLMILPMDFTFDIYITTYSSWNFFIAVTGIPCLLSLIMLLTLPESPRFLLNIGELEKALKVLERMFTTNSGKPASQYPVKIARESPDIPKFFVRRRRSSFHDESKLYTRGVYIAHRELFHKAPLKIAQTCLLDFGINFSYLTMILWIPELLDRYQKHFKQFHEQVTLCRTGSAKVTEDRGPICPVVLENEMFYNAMIISASCVPSIIALYFAIMYIDKRILLVFTLAGSASATVALTLAVTELGQLISYCVIEALSTLMETILFVCIIEIFSASVRGTALSLTVTFGRIGAVLGNIIMGLLIDKHCEIPLYIFAAVFFLGGVLSMTLPAMKVSRVACRT